MTWDTIWNELQGTGFWSIALRLVLSVVFAGFIGMERESKNQAAGFRTYILVCLGSCLTMITNIHVCQLAPGVFTADASRIAASVVSGIGFLGAGTIIVTGKHRIKGLTTAAGLWACACMGIALGSGFYTGALVTFLLILFSMTVLGRLDRTLYKKTRVVRFFVEFGSISQVKFFISCMKEHQVKIQSFETYQDITRHSDLVTLVALTEMARDRDVQALIEDIRQLDGVTFVEVIG
ncbi:MAG: MgtC/SapB family protein [Oscillospiraceae bacterium]|jgi:putative Mg2+ transporter-C (MgtC) family protein|nr:MgtC/SapB family protein [Oscillospiraceae bacterium]